MNSEVQSYFWKMETAMSDQKRKKARFAMGGFDIFTHQTMITIVGLGNYTRK